MVTTFRALSMTSNFGCFALLRVQSKRTLSFRHKPINGRVDRASVIETVDSGSITGRLKPKAIKIDFHSFPVKRSAIKRTM